MLAVLLSLTGQLSAQRAAERLEGCSDPAVLATGLKTLREKGWANVSIDYLLNTWPTMLRALDRGPNGWDSVVSEDRIIKGEMECGELFYFDLTLTPDGTVNERLDYITVRYTGRTREQTEQAAKLLSRAIGLTEGQTASLGRDADQSFGWGTTSSGGPAFGLNLEWES